MLQEDLQKKLFYLGLSPEESRIYLELLQKGEASPMELSVSTKLKRPSVYNYLEALAKKGFVQWIETNKGKKAEALDPKNFSNILESERSRYLQMEDTYKDILPTLELIKKRKNFKTEVKYYEGKEGLRQMISNSLNAQDIIYGYSSYQRNKMVGEDFMETFRKGWVARRLIDKVITNDEELNRKFPKDVIVQEYLDFQEVRFLPKETFYVSTDVMIYNNVFAVGSLDKEDVFGVEIINEEMVKTQMSIFNALWNIAKPMKWITNQNSQAAQ